jgi:hypothetical protein
VSVYPWAWTLAVVTEVRPLFGTDGNPAAWPSERGPRVGGRPSTAESGSGLFSGVLVAEDSFDDFGVLG